MKIIKEELRFEENLKKRLKFICEFPKVTPTFVNGSIIKIEKNYISYIEPHRVIVKDVKDNLCVFFDISFFVRRFINWLKKRKNVDCI